MGWTTFNTILVMPQYLALSDTVMPLNKVGSSRDFACPCSKNRRRVLPVADALPIAEVPRARCPLRPSQLPAFGSFFAQGETTAVKSAGVQGGGIELVKSNFWVNHIWSSNTPVKWFAVLIWILHKNIVYDNIYASVLIWILHKNIVYDNIYASISFHEKMYSFILYFSCSLMVC